MELDKTNKINILRGIGGYMKKDFEELELSQLIESASEVLGFDESHLSELLGKQLSFRDLDINKLSISSYVKLSEFYYLSEINFRCFYSKEAHVRKIGQAISERNFKHKLSLVSIRIFLIYLRESFENDLYSSRRLRIQNLLNRIFNSQVRLPTYEDIFPYSIRKVLYLLNKEYCFRKHILKYGDYRDFCYYDRRYDPEEKCSSKYYKELYQKHYGDVLELNQ